MRLRRRPKPERVVAELVNRATGDELVSMRRAMHRAVVLIGAGEPEMARDVLRDALQERWWK